MPQSQPVNPPIPDPVFSSKDALLEEYAAIIRNDRVDDNRPHERSVVTCKRG